MYIYIYILYIYNTILYLELPDLCALGSLFWVCLTRIIHFLDIWSLVHLCRLDPLLDGAIMFSSFLGWTMLNLFFGRNCILCHSIYPNYQWFQNPTFLMVISNYIMLYGVFLKWGNPESFKNILVLKHMGYYKLSIWIGSSTINHPAIGVPVF